MSVCKSIISFFRDFLRSRFYIEVLLICVFSIFIFAYAAKNDIFEKLVEYSRTHEELEVDEFFVLLMVSSFAFLAILIRNAKYLRLEIAQRQKAEVKIKRLAYFDSLTGLQKRELCQDNFRNALRRDRRANLKTAIFFIDLDNFKDVNDLYGHKGGDELLVALTKRISGNLRDNDVFSRFAGDEFVLIVESVKSSSEIRVLADKLIALMNEPFVIQGNEIRMTLSIGIAMHPDDGHDVESLYQNADAAMYQAKREGKSTFRFYSTALERLEQNKLHVRTCLASALKKNELSILYQPIINVATGKIIGSEALLRWHCKEFGEVSPEIFIPIAEESALIGAIGQWVFSQACKQTKEWQNKGHRPIKMSINMSSRELIQEDYVEKITKILAEIKLEPKHIELELTETALMNNVDDSQQKLVRLNELGISIALDDFGTGFSSLEHLRRFKLSKIKIDRSFIKNIPHVDEGVKMTKAIIYLGYWLGLQVTAEGIETKEQLELLRDTECDSAQGYFLSKPITAVEFEALLKADQTLG